MDTSVEICKKLFCIR